MGHEGGKIWNCKLTHTVFVLRFNLRTLVEALAALQLFFYSSEIQLFALKLLMSVIVELILH